MKQIIVFLSVIAIVAVGIWGSVLPYRKAGLYSSVSGRISQGVTLEQFENLSSLMLDSPSPIGKDEGVKMLMGRTSSIIMRTKNIPKDIVDRLLRFNEKYFAPTIGAGRGGNFTQNFVLAGALYQSAGIVLNDASYFKKAEQYYTEGLKYSPKRPQLLYGLFDTYRALGDVSSAKKIGATMLSYWPDDEDIIEKLQELQ